MARSTKEIKTVPPQDRPTPGIKFKKRERTTRIIVHQSHTPPSDEKWADVAYWQGRGMGLLETGYHFIIERDGSVVEARDYELIGCGTPLCNMDSVQICLVGGVGEAGPEDNFTKEQKRALTTLCTMLCLHYRLDPEKQIFGHTELPQYKKRTMVCPMYDMEDLRASVSAFVWNTNKE